jgi:hypothetical protein
MPKHLTKRGVVGTLSSRAKQSVQSVVQAGQLSKLTPVMYIVLKLRGDDVSTNLHLLTDVARNILTAAYYHSIKKKGTQSPFAHYNQQEEEWEPVGTMKWEEEQGLLYNRMLCADMVRQLKTFGFIDVTKRKIVRRDYRLPLMPAHGHTNFSFSWQQKFHAVQELAEVSPFKVPGFLKGLGIGERKYETMLRYVAQEQYIEQYWDELLDQADWQTWASVSDEYTEHGADLSFEFMQRIGLL